MKTILSSIIALFLFVFIANPAQAEEGSSFAIVDVQALLRDSKAAKSLQKQVESAREKLQKEFSKKEDELRKEEKKLMEERTSLEQEEFAKKAKGFEAKLFETRELVQKRKRALEKALSKSLAKLRNEIAKIVGDIANERDYQAVFIKQQVIIVASKSIDITDEVMEKLNKKISKINLDVEK